MNQSKPTSSWQKQWKIHFLFIPSINRCEFRSGSGMHLQFFKDPGIKASKCERFRRKMSHLGRLISSEWYRPNQMHFEAGIKLLEATPKNVTDVRRLLVLLGYFQKSILDFSIIAAPLFQILKSKPTTKSLIKQLADSPFLAKPWF